MIIKASERGSARNLANHLINTKDNDHVELYEVRGLVGNSLHAALLEIDGVSQGTQSKKPFSQHPLILPKGKMSAITSLLPLLTSWNKNWVYQINHGRSFFMKRKDADTPM